jgi:hypothetical protein
MDGRHDKLDKGVQVQPASRGVLPVAWATTALLPGVGQHSSLQQRLPAVYGSTVRQFKAPTDTAHGIQSNYSTVQCGGYGVRTAVEIESSGHVGISLFRACTRSACHDVAL